MECIYFWQNTLSIHQSDFLEALAYNYNVVLVVKDSKNGGRIDEGWSSPNLNNVKVVSFDLIEWKKIDWSAIHVVSGLGVYADFNKVMKRVLHAHGECYLLTEKPNLNKLKGFLRYIRYFLWLWYRSKMINGIFCMGANAKEWLSSFPLTQFSLYEFLYAGPSGVERRKRKNNNVNKFLYIGRVEHAKGIDLYLRLAREYPDCEFNVIGKCLSPELVEEMDLASNVSYLGVISNKELKNIISCYDCLILPSRHDGWGYVVNECLAAGVPCVVSDACGAQSVIKSGFNGEVFASGNYADLNLSIVRVMETEFHSDQISSFFKGAISAKVISSYFIDCINANPGFSPRPPWRQ